jgi:hypothetical protein
MTTYYDARDYDTNPATSKPTERPTKIWVPYYLGLQGNWIFSFPYFDYETAIKYARMLQRPYQMLEYTLDNTEQPVTTTKLVKKKVRLVKG